MNSSKITAAIAYLWQLPQNLVGELAVAVLRPEQNYDWRGVRVHYASRMRGGISLGRHIIVAEAVKDYNGKTEDHEWGHTRQSLMLGPLYLFVVGIPSLLWAAWWNEDRNRSYHSFWTEVWADRLGGVERC